MNTRKIQGKFSSLIEWYEKNDRPLPWRVLWAKTKDPYVVWVSEIMLQQTTIKVVEPKYRSFLNSFPNLKSLATASEDSIREAVRGLGYYRRFRLMHQCAQVVYSRRNTTYPEGLWPHDSRGLQELPGIGSYTAAAIASIAFSEKIAVLDGNVERVICRLFGLKVNPKEPIQKKALGKLAQSILESGYDNNMFSELEKSLPSAHNQAMMELGQLICTPTNPLCKECPLKQNCKSFRENTQQEIPLVIPRKAPVPIEMHLQIITKKKKNKIEVALFERHEQAKFLKGTRGFVSYWRNMDKKNSIEQAEKRYPLIGTVKHSITNHKILARVTSSLEVLGPLLLTENWKRDSNLEKIQWIPAAQVEESLVSNLDRKAWKIFQKTLVPANI